MTLQEIVDLARIPLNDDDKDRYSDATLLKFLIHGMLVGYRNRWDLFMSGGTVPSTAMTLSSTFPLGEEFASVFADYVTARAESVDDESINTNRAAQFATLFASVVPG